MVRRTRLLALVSLASLAAGIGCGKVEHLTDSQMAATQVTITITRDGDGTGAVTSLPLGIDCGTSCSLTVDAGTPVTLTAAPDATSTFAGWNGGGCSGTGPCTIEPTSDVSVDASFPKKQITVTVAPTGNGTGTVASAPAGVTCGATCSAMFEVGTPITLTPAADASSTFVGWTGAGCDGTTAPCTFTPTADTTVQAGFALDDSLVVTLGGNGTGTVTSSDAHIDCGTDCSYQYAPASKVTLTAAADAISKFTGWSGGGCTGTGTCTVTIDAATQVTATFTLKQFTLTVATNGGNGTGTVTSADGDISCGATCSHAYDDGTMVTLTAAPATGSTFAGWSGGGCTGTGTCAVTIAAATTVTARFTLQQETLTVSAAGTGTGTVSSSPSGISCGQTCSAGFTFGTMVTLTATPAANATFGGWGGACSGTGPCTVTMSAATSVTATFTLDQYTLTAAKSGTGAGTVASTDGDISCGGTCSHAYDDGTMVTLTASPATGSTFAGWTSGGCSGTGSCSVTVHAATTVTAQFTQQQETLSVSVGGTGGGGVSSSPAGINCTGSCNASFAYGTVVTLTPSAGTGSTFAGWGGACSGLGGCAVTMNAAASVTATFTLQQETLTVATNGGNGSGTVTSAPGGINCGGACSAGFAFGSVVTLTPSASAGSSFTGWSGACSGTGACTVSMTQAQSVTAAFALGTVTLSVGSSGGGNGNIASTDGNIHCPETCSASYLYGTQVTLTATAGTGSTFTGWSGGGCSGTGSCTTTLDGSETVTAQFTPIDYTLTVSNSATLGGSGTITTSVGGIKCGTACQATLAYGTFVTLTAIPDAGSSFAGWGGACSGTSLTCSISIQGATTVTGSFTCETITFMYTGAVQTYTVPACATRVHIAVWGAQGASSYGSGGGSAQLGGLGGFAQGDLAVTTGQQLSVYVGGQSGWNGGGLGADDYAPANGGDASDVRSGGTALTNRIIVGAGGGGGIHSDGGNNWSGGGGGGGTCGTYYCGGGGGQGNGGSGGNASTAPGSGVTATDAGGAGGGGTDGNLAGGRASCATRYVAAPGTCGGQGETGQGGAGEAIAAQPNSANCYSGFGGTAGGGGGYLGGGGTAVGNCGGGGGGGGSSWISGTLTNPVLQGSKQPGLGQVTITPF